MLKLKNAFFNLSEEEYFYLDRQSYIYIYIYQTLQIKFRLKLESNNKKQANPTEVDSTLIVATFLVKIRFFQKLIIFSWGKLVHKLKSYY